uniref:Threonylcarbamoyl-AMP synthase n=1 Tax=Psychrobacter sp. (strain PRwf-1) TaxID=349106 RepID=A5WI25_PSYWF
MAYRRSIVSMKSETMNATTEPNGATTTSPEQAAQWLQQGKLLAYPTESVWGIGCDAYNQQAVEQILAIKNRPSEKGMIVVTDSIERIRPLLQQLPQSRQQQIIASWSTRASEENAAHTQQAHTWLLPLKTAEFSATTEADHEDTNTQDIGAHKANASKAHDPHQPGNEALVPYWITGKHDSIAVRVIAHPLIAQLCQQMVSSANPYGLVVSTSCNPSGDSPAKSFEQAYAYFGQDIAYLQGETLGYVLPSQISDASSGQVIR